MTGWGGSIGGMKHRHWSHSTAEGGWISNTTDAITAKHGEISKLDHSEDTKIPNDTSFFDDDHVPFSDQ